MFTICDFVFMLMISVLTDAKMRLETLHVDSTYRSTDAKMRLPIQSEFGSNFSL